MQAAKRVIDLHSLVGDTGYVFDIVVLIILTLNFGMGGAVLLAAISLCVLFKRMESRGIDAVSGL